MKATKAELQVLLKLRDTELANFQNTQNKSHKIEFELRQENKRLISLLRHVIVQYSELVRDSMLREAGLYQPKKEK